MLQLNSVDSGHFTQLELRNHPRRKVASPGLKLVSPGRRTCELDRPVMVTIVIQFGNG